MQEADQILLQRLVEKGDSEAFAAIMRQYASMVYSTGRRVLGDDGQAADIVQETFFQFLKSADQITGSIGSWLHRVATRRAIDLVRKDASRRRREQTYATEAFDETDWSEIEPLVDEALEKIPADSRELLILHFLKGQSLSRIALAKDCSQPTISRRVTAALEQLRGNLRARNVVVSLVVLGTMLEQSAQAAPAQVLDSLGKIALAQAAATGAEAGATAATLFAAGAKAALVIAAVALAAGGVWVVRHRQSSRPASGSARVMSVKSGPAAAQTKRFPATETAVSENKIAESLPPKSEPALNLSKSAPTNYFAANTNFTGTIRKQQFSTVTSDRRRGYQWQAGGSVQGEFSFGGGGAGYAGAGAVGGFAIGNGSPFIQGQANPGPAFRSPGSLGNIRNFGRPMQPRNRYNARLLRSTTNYSFSSTATINNGNMSRTQSVFQSTR